MAGSNIERSPVDALLPTLLHIQGRLDQDLSLEALAERAGQSTWHFHKQFLRAVGETPKRYTSRLRLERAAFLLLIFDDRVLDVALDCGFQNHETFSRAFRRHFGSSPTKYREHHRGQSTNLVRRARQILEDEQRGFELSEPRVRRLAPMTMAFLRHLGPYEDVPASLYDELVEWGGKRGHIEPGQAPVLLGIGHDAPGVTPPEKLRYDVGLRVKGTFVPEGQVGCQILDSGLFAVTQHVGALSTLPLAYQALSAQLESLKGYAVQGLPIVEIYATSPVTEEFEVNRTEICLPVVATR